LVYPRPKNFALQNSSHRKLRAALCRFDAISLSLNKEMAKENRFRQAEIASLLVS
jgi:hypothetical protein